MAPNILVIMSDEHDVGVTGCYGNSIVQTPHLDALAGEGITFNAAYTTSPLCVPARLSFTAGKYISRCGAWSNSCWLPSDDYPSIARMMSAAGYRSLLCGKQHYDATRRYGFHEIGGNMNRHYKTGHGGRRAPEDERVNTRSRDQRFAQFRTAPTSGIIEHDEQVTRGASDFLSRWRQADGPFFLFAGYLAPHFPLTVPESYYRRYEDKVPMPHLPEGSVDGQPLNYHHLRRGFGVVETDPQTVKRGRELYYGLTDWLDDQIGSVMAALGDSEARDNTVVIYTSDHGENKGDHHLWWKNCMYEHASRVPLIIRWPERWRGGQVRDGACSLVDLVQTIAQIGEARVPEDWDGDPMCEWMDDVDTGWKDLAVSEYYAHNIASGFAMLRSGKHKYVYHTRMGGDYGPEEELYDLCADPGELDNLAGDPGNAQRMRQMYRALVAELGQDPEDTEAICRQDYAVGYGRPPRKPPGESSWLADDGIAGVRNE